MDKTGAEKYLICHKLWVVLLQMKFFKDVQNRDFARQFSPRMFGFNFFTIFVIIARFLKTENEGTINFILCRPS